MTQSEHISSDVAAAEILARHGVIVDLKRPETWKSAPDAARYEMSDKGRMRRVRDGLILAQSVKNGYLQVKYTDDTGRRRDALVHRLVLLAFEGPPEPGQESCHSKAGPLFNWWPEGVRWGTKPENEADKPVPPQPPVFDCRYKHKCGNTVTKEDGSCGPCSEEDGRRVARMLAAGVNLEVAAVRINRSSDWAYKIAVKYGGYQGTIRQARLQQPSLSQRVRITLRERRADGWADSAGDAA